MLKPLKLNKSVFSKVNTSVVYRVYVTRPGKIGLIYIKYTCLYYGKYLLFCMCYPNSVTLIDFLIDFYMYDDILDTILITDKKLLHFKVITLSPINEPFLSFNIKQKLHIKSPKVGILRTKFIQGVHQTLFLPVQI